MAKIEKFEDLEIWNKSREICIDIETLFETTNLGKRFSIKDQIDRSSGSIMDNIAEGFERNGNREFINFLSGKIIRLCHKKVLFKFCEEEN